jgi:hypothetical protein
VISWLSSAPPPPNKYRDSTSITPPPLPSKPFLIHDLSTDLQFDATRMCFDRLNGQFWYPCSGSSSAPRNTICCTNPFCYISKSRQTLQRSLMATAWAILGGKLFPWTRGEFSLSINRKWTDISPGCSSVCVVNEQRWSRR